jgi:hypothetical protein
MDLTDVHAIGNRYLYTCNKRYCWVSVPNAFTTSAKKGGVHVTRSKHSTPVPPKKSIGCKLQYLPATSSRAMCDKQMTKNRQGCARSHGQYSFLPSVAPHFCEPAAEVAGIVDTPSAHPVERSCKGLLPRFWRCRAARCRNPAPASASTCAVWIRDYK